MLIWATHGPYAGQFLDLSENQARQALTDGWAENPAGKSSLQMSYPSKESHEQAEAFAEEFDMSGKQRRSYQIKMQKRDEEKSYQTREMRAEEPSKPVRIEEDDLDESEETEAPVKRPVGRPKKG